MRAWLHPSFLVSAFVVVCSAAAADPPKNVEQPVPVPEAELRQITLGLLERYPELASSPGVKLAEENPGGPGETTATVIFYPHAESHGIKEAFQAFCVRRQASDTWTCNSVELRRYVRLATQDFEVRVLGDLTSDAALALLEASRRDLLASVTRDPPSTAIIVLPRDKGSYLVHWGTPEGITLSMLARLAEGGDPANPDAWHASIFEFPK